MNAEMRNRIYKWIHKDLNKAEMEIDALKAQLFHARREGYAAGVEAAARKIEQEYGTIFLPGGLTVGDVIRALDAGDAHGEGGK